MSHPVPTTVIVPVNLGAASKYEDDIFPRAYHRAGNAITKGDYLLKATLEEMIKIAQMGIDLNTDTRFRYNARVQYETLAAEEARLKSRPKSFNPFTMFRHYRSMRMFHAAAKALYLDTKHTSERIQREEMLMQALPSTELHAVDDAVPQDATISGIAVELPGTLDDDAQQKILAATNAMVLRASISDPFLDNPQVTQLRDDDSIITLADTASLLSQDASNGNPQVAAPLSPGASSYHFYFYNSVLTTGSNVHEMTLNHGLENRDPSIVQQPSQ